MEFALPEFPHTFGAQSAFVSAALIAVIGILLIAVPVTIGRFVGLDSRETRPGAIGELRVAGGFLAGLALSSLLFDQPVLYAALGVALAVSFFGRILSFMSDRSFTLVQGLLLVLQAGFAVACLSYFTDVFTPEVAFAIPAETGPKLVFYIYCTLAVLGAFVMLAPGLAMLVPGLSRRDGLASGNAVLRSAGGLMLGASGAALLLMNPMLDLGMAAALVLATGGRVLSLMLNRGNLIYNAIALLLQAVAAFLVADYILGMM